MGPLRAGAHQQQGSTKSRGPPRAGAHQHQGSTKSRGPLREGAHQQQGPPRAGVHQEQGSTKSRGPPTAGVHQQQGPTNSRGRCNLSGGGGCRGPKEARSIGARPWVNTALTITITLTIISLFVFFTQVLVTLLAFLCETALEQTVRSSQHLAAQKLYSRVSVHRPVMNTQCVHADSSRRRVQHNRCKEND